MHLLAYFNPFLPFLGVGEKPKHKLQFCLPPIICVQPNTKQQGIMSNCPEVTKRKQKQTRLTEPIYYDTVARATLLGTIVRTKIARVTNEQHLTCINNSDLISPLTLTRDELSKAHCIPYGKPKYQDGGEGYNVSAEMFYFVVMTLCVSFKDIMNVNVFVV